MIKILRFTLISNILNHERDIQASFTKFVFQGKTFSSFVRSDVCANLLFITALPYFIFVTPFPGLAQ